jgi:hypothetical protein
MARAGREREAGVRAKNGPGARPLPEPETRNYRTWERLRRTRELEREGR